MKKSLFVAGLDFSVDNEALKEIFSQHGTVEMAKIVTDQNKPSSNRGSSSRNGGFNNPRW